MHILLESSNIVNAARKVTQRDKGNLKYEFPSNYVVVDIETTGLTPEFDDIIEIGAIRISNNSLVESYQTLINPAYPNEFVLDDFISELTGITSTDINNQGIPITSALIELREFIGDSLLVAHNANFDINFLYDAYLDNLGFKFQNDYVDTMYIARYYAFKSPEMRHHRVTDFITKFNLTNDSEHTRMHRALNDAMYEKQILDLEKDKLGVDWTKPKYKKNWKNYSKTLDVVVNTEADEDNPFYGLNIVFTGKLTQFTRNEAHEFMAQLGATPQDSVRVDTDFLIVGMQTNNVGSSGKSAKQIKAEKINLNGKGEITITSDDEFLKMISEWIN